MKLSGNLHGRMMKWLASGEEKMDMERLPSSSHILSNAEDVEVREEGDGL